MRPPPSSTPTVTLLPYATLSRSSYVAPDRRRIVSLAQLPIAHSDKSMLVAFRGVPEQGEHLALLVGGAPAHDTTPLVRLHSECLTGDVLGSLKCDCGPQLHAALEIGRAHV